MIQIIIITIIIIVIKILMIIIVFYSQMPIMSHSAREHNIYSYKNTTFKTRL